MSVNCSSDIQTASAPTGFSGLRSDDSNCLGHSDLRTSTHIVSDQLTSTQLLRLKKIQHQSRLKGKIFRLFPLICCKTALVRDKPRYEKNIFSPPKAKTRQPLEDSVRRLAIFRRF
jgi:hypothetical protein